MRDDTMTTTQGNATRPAASGLGAGTRVCAIFLAGVSAALLPLAAVRASDTVAAAVTPINERLGLRASTPFALVVAPDGGVATAGYRFDVPIDGVTRSLVLAPFSNRAPDFSVEAQVADGSYQRVDVGPPKTLRGTVSGLEGSSAAGVLGEDGLRALILMPDDTRLWIQPAPELAVAGGADHVLYRGDDVLPTGATCGTKVTEPFAADDTGAIAGTIAGSGTISIAELAADADFDYFTNYGDAALVGDEIESIVNLINIQYERDVQIRHVITRIIVRTSEPNVYSRTCSGGSNDGGYCSGNDDCPDGVCPSDVNADTLLRLFRTQWDTEHTQIHRDVAQLFTGKHMMGSAIGVAWMPSDGVTTICGMEASSNHGYSVVTANCAGCDTMATRTDLSAHELGHNWGAAHCDCPTWTMNPYITEANRFHPIYSIPSIVAYRDTRTCLDQGDELLRLILSVERTSLSEGDTLQLTAEADFLLGPNQDVTADTVWTVQPPEAGTVDGSGVFTPGNVNGSLCVTVSATYTANGIEKSSRTSFTLFDAELPLAVTSADPPYAAIDARQPTDPNGLNPVGWDRVTITLNGDICTPSVFDFDVTSTGAIQPAPQVLTVSAISPSTYTLRLTDSIEPGAWTDITHIDTGATTRVGYLPADVNGDGTAGAADILDLIDALNNVGPQRQIWSMDIDRSGVAGAPDILALIDLLNGAGGFDPWNNVTLP